MKRKNSNPFSLFSFQDIITGLCGIMIFFVLIMIIDLAMSRTVDAIVEENETLEKEKVVQGLQDKIKELEQVFGDLQMEALMLDAKSEHQLSAVERYQQEEEVKNLLKENEAIKQDVENLKKEYVSVKEVYENEVKALSEKKEEKVHVARSIEPKKGIGVTYIPEKSNFKRPVFVVCDCEAIKMYRQSIATLKYEELILPFDNFRSEFSSILTKKLNKNKDTLIFLIRPSGVKYATELVEIARGKNFSIGRDPLEEDLKISFAEK